jgi:prophage antirepressor-like protein
MAHISRRVAANPSVQLDCGFLPLHFQGEPIRVRLDHHNQLWFVTADVCNVLAQQPVGWTLAGLREEEKGLHSEEGPGSTGLTLALISEAGLQRLLRGGLSPAAGRMQRWLMQEVLPWLHR